MTFKKILQVMFASSETEKPVEPEEDDKAPDYFDYVQVQAIIEEMSDISRSIEELDRLISDLQMFQPGKHEGGITLTYTDLQGNKRTVNFWLDGDISGDSFSADLLQDVINERDRKCERLQELMKRKSP